MPTTVSDAFLAVSATLESLGKVVALLDEGFRIVDASPALRGLLGTPEVEGRALGDFVDATSLIDCMRAGRRCDRQCQTRSGRMLRVTGAVLPDGSFVPEARYVISIDLEDGLADTDSASGEAEKILRALETNRWRRSAAARALGISRATLWRRMRDFGML
jgi:transcriptional regulator of acetoin/glycerol metabolism